jgi:hypothetical protein
VRARKEIRDGHARVYDPRGRPQGGARSPQRRGQRYPWDPDHGCLGQGRASWGIGQWVQEHAAELGDRLGWPAPRLPREATLRRALRELDLGTLEDCLLRIRPATEAPKPGRWQGQALDGKGLRGARAHDRPIHLLGLMSHQGRVLTQLLVAEHANEITAAPALLAGRCRARSPRWMPS